MSARELEKKPILFLKAMSRLSLTKRLFVSFLFFILLFCAFVQFGPLPKYKADSPNISIGQKDISEGRRLALTICVRCHFNEQTKSFAGRQHGNPKRLGVFFSGNITQDLATGIGTWQPGEIYFFLRTGIKPDGSYVFDMPKYPNLSDEDILSLVAFLKSNDPLVKPTYSLNPRPRFSFLTKFLLHFVLSPPSYSSLKVSSPDTNDFIAYGRYLVTCKFSCYDCHSRNMVTNNANHPEKSWGFLRGGNPHVNERGDKVLSSNITGDKKSGIGDWTEEEFVHCLKTGVKPTGGVLRDPMFPFPLISDREASAIYRYLMTIDVKGSKERSN